MAGRRGAVQVAPEVRGAVMRALKIVEGMKTDRPEDNVGKKYAGMSLSEMFADMLAEGQVETVLNLLARFCPKEMLIDVNADVSMQAMVFNPGDLTDVIKFARERAALADGNQGGDAAEVRGLPALDTAAGAAGESVPIAG